MTLLHTPGPHFQDFQSSSYKSSQNQHDIILLLYEFCLSVHVAFTVHNKRSKLFLCIFSLHIQALSTPLLALLLFWITSCTSKITGLCQNEGLVLLKLKFCSWIGRFSATAVYFMSVKYTLQERMWACAAETQRGFVFLKITFFVIWTFGRCVCRVKNGASNLFWWLSLLLESLDSGPATALVM